jgi:FkbM family methyltransferase
MSNSHFIFRVGKAIVHGIGKPFKNPYIKLGIGWWRVKILKNTSDSGVQNLNFLGHKICFFKKADFLHSLNEIFIENVYKLTYSPSATIIDCGSNIGLSIIYLKQIFPDAKIYAFEPDDENFSLLKRNMEAFHFDGVELHKAAIWTEETVLQFSNSGTLGSRIESGSHSGTTPVKSFRLKNLVQQPIYFLKLDIEGAEFSVLNDLGNDIKNIKNLFIEYHGKFEQNNELIEILELVSRNGFNFYIKEAASVYGNPFIIGQRKDFDLQLNIFCFKTI